MRAFFQFIAEVYFYFSGEIISAVNAVDIHITGFQVINIGINREIFLMSIRQDLLNVRYRSRGIHSQQRVSRCETQARELTPVRWFCDVKIGEQLEMMGVRVNM